MAVRIRAFENGALRRIVDTMREKEHVARENHIMRGLLI
jgi:hypothetical protein